MAMSEKLYHVHDIDADVNWVLRCLGLPPDGRIDFLTNDGLRVRIKVRYDEQNGRAEG